MKSSQLLIISQDLMLQLKAPAVEHQLVTIWSNVKPTLMLNSPCLKFHITWTPLLRILKALKLIWKNIHIYGKTVHKKDLFNFWNKIFLKFKLLKVNKKSKKKIFFWKDADNKFQISIFLMKKLLISKSFKLKSPKFKLQLKRLGLRLILETLSKLCKLKLTVGLKFTLIS